MSHRETICACSVARVVLKRLRWGDTRGKPRGWSRCQISSTILKKNKSSPPPGSFRPARLISHHHSLSKEGEQLKLKDGKEMSKKRKLATSAASVQTSPLVSRARAPPPLRSYYNKATCTHRKRDGSPTAGEKSGEGSSLISTHDPRALRWAGFGAI